MQVDLYSGRKTVVRVFVCLTHHIYLYNSHIFSRQKKVKIYNKKIHFT